MLQILNSSVVVAAAAHNPSILHPSFLVAEKIVPDSWQLAEPPLCTPPLSLVKYQNGIAISVEQEKLQVVDNEPGDPVSSQVPEIAERYTRTLPYTRYTGVGINVNGFVETADAKAILERFVAPGPWNEGELQASAVGVRFVYAVLGTRLRIAFDGGAVQKTGGPSRSGVVIAANYHVDLSGPDLAAELSTAIRRYSTCCLKFHEIVETILQLRAEHAAH